MIDSPAPSLRTDMDGFLTSIFMRPPVIDDSDETMLPSALASIFMYCFSLVSTMYMVLPPSCMSM
jgi:hypothetical protein